MEQAYYTGPEKAPTEAVKREVGDMLDKGERPQVRSMVGGHECYVVKADHFDALWQHARDLRGACKGLREQLGKARDLYELLERADQEKADQINAVTDYLNGEEHPIEVNGLLDQVLTHFGEYTADLPFEGGTEGPSMPDPEWDELHRESTRIRIEMEKKQLEILNELKEVMDHSQGMPLTDYVELARAALSRQ